MKPTVFIGSATENLDVAYAIQHNLDRTADVTVWTQGVVQLSSTILDDLLATLKQSDFGIFVFAPADMVQMRDEQLSAVRDNVVFEFGLFVGKLGKERSFYVVPRDQKDFRVLSDLVGITAAEYDSSRPDVQAALGPACFQIQQQIKKLGIRQDRIEQPDVEQITNPKILCAASPRFETMGFPEDVAVLSDAFPQGTMVEHNLTSWRLGELLTQHRFDILHLLTFVDPKTGELVLNADEEGMSDEPDSITAEGFAKLIDLCEARLVILASCNSLLLAAYLAPHVNMIAATDWVTNKEFLRWEKSFYQCLSRGSSLSTAAEIGKATSRAPMILLMKKNLSFAQS